MDNTTFPTIEGTLQLVEALYAGKQDRGGQLKSDHVRRVVAGMPPDTTYAGLQMAALHDVMEDFPLVTAETLRHLGYTEYVIYGASLLTHPCFLTYDEYITRLITSEDRNVLYVKLSDNTDNTCLKRRALCTESDQRWHIDRCEKVYYPTRRRLIEAIKNLTGEVIPQ